MISVWNTKSYLKILLNVFLLSENYYENSYITSITTMFIVYIMR